jgi:hypothetical protein
MKSIEQILCEDKRQDQLIAYVEKNCTCDADDSIISKHHDKDCKCKEYLKKMNEGNDADLWDDNEGPETSKDKKKKDIYNVYNDLKAKKFYAAKSPKNKDDEEHTSWESKEKAESMAAAYNKKYYKK